MWEFLNRLFNIPIKSTGISNVKITRNNKGKWYANGRPVSDGYSYYDKGNTFQFKDGKRYLIRQTPEAKKQSDIWIKETSKRINENKKIDQKIANKTSYGWNTENKTLGGLSRRRLKRNVDPSSRYDLNGAVENFFPWAFNYGAYGTLSFNSTKPEQAIWERHLGFKRNIDAMPISGVRFMGDYKNGKIRLPNAEYTGLTKEAKKQILKDIENGDIQIKYGNQWTPIEEGPLYNRAATSQYANYGIRENNNSGIYEVFDTYDFDDHWYNPNLNRPNGKQIEIRDTIHGKNADDRLYNPYLRSKK